MATNRVAFLVDGFNVYHSIRDVERRVGDASAKWLDFRSLLQVTEYRPVAPLVIASFLSYHRAYIKDVMNASEPVWRTVSGL